MASSPKTEKTTWRAWVQIGASEMMYLAGLISLFMGLWIWFGLGPALVADGGILVSTAMMNGWLMAKAEAGNVI